MTRFRDGESVGLPLAAEVAPYAAPPATIFLSGDVMTGRGVDQILPTPSRRELREDFVKDAAGYVALAERAHGPIPRPVAHSYIWGDALPVLEQVKPRARLVNLETSVTVSNDFWPGKGINYRMHPANIQCLQAARVDVCVLANNHVLDFGRSGLAETLDVLRAVGIRTVGAGRDLNEARRPVRLDLGEGAALLVFAFGCESSGIPRDWAAGPSRSGVDLLSDLSTKTAEDVAARVRASRRPGDIVLVSVHWGSNWGYEIDPEQAAFAHRLVEGGVDIVHGHSSHHVRPVEIYKDRLILYGCGDLINDYEGIEGQEEWRGDLGAMYFPTIAPQDGSLVGLRVTPMHMRKLRLTRPARADEILLAEILSRISRPYGSRFEWHDTGTIVLKEPRVGAAP
jgi:poly-gamma-glutamate synthesis protein (capsule biosynthesis protein)